MDPRAKKTITALRTALFRLLKTTTVDDITVTGLCREAGINRRTFYLHYDNVLEVFNDYEDQLASRVRQTLMAPSTTETNLIATFDQIFDENLAGFTNLCFNHRQERLIQALNEMLFTTMLSIRSCQPLAQDIITMRYASSGIVDVYVYWINHQGDFSRQDLSKTVKRLVERNLDLNTN